MEQLSSEIDPPKPVYTSYGGDIYQMTARIVVRLLCIVLIVTKTIFMDGLAV